MGLSFSAKDEAFRKEVASWLRSHLTGKFSQLKYRGGPGDEGAFPDERKHWEQQLYAGGWSCIGWPEAYGGRGCTIVQQVIFNEEYARFGGPGRLSHIGEGLLGPTLINFGSAAQKARFLPGILRAETFWCQGYSEPNAGSDLSNIATKAKFDAEENLWRISGQKVWTSLAHLSDFCFVMARCIPGSKGHRGLGFFLVPMTQSGVDLQPIRQLTGTSEFNEVFFQDALSCEHGLIGEPGEGWKIAMALLGYERGVSTLGQQMQFQNELNQMIAIAKENGAYQDPLIRQRLAKAHVGLRIMRSNSLRMLAEDNQGHLKPEALIYKLFWSNWHRDLGKLAMDVLQDESELIASSPYELTPLQSLFLFVRSDTIYGGTNQIQRNIIAERGLGMPKENRY